MIWKDKNHALKGVVCFLFLRGWSGAKTFVLSEAKNGFFLS